MEVAERTVKKIRDCELYLGDCLEVMDELIGDGVVVDAVITDPPYGTTACKWDSVIPFDEMWKKLNKLIKPNSAIVFFGSEPFSSALRISNIKNYKYDWIWDKKAGLGFLDAKFRPLKSHENILIFGLNGSGVSNGSKIPMKYNPQGLVQTSKTNRNSKSNILNSEPKVREFKNVKTGYPKSIICFVKDKKTVHPTQKPVPLMEYLIKTYTNEGETVLDFTMGSGSTGVACVNTNRRFIGIEKDEGYFDVAVDRISNHTVQTKIF
jgi:site-specific DNA-methyltransferase (adenine-specific)